jgi:hypothetical protein
MCKQNFKRLNNKWPSNFTSKPKHLQENWILEIDLFNTRELQNQTKLTYFYNFKKLNKETTLESYYGKWVNHVNKIEIALFHL